MVLGQVGGAVVLMILGAVGMLVGMDVGAADRNCKIDWSLSKRNGRSSSMCHRP